MEVTVKSNAHTTVMFTVTGQSLPTDTMKIVCVAGLKTKTPNPWPLSKPLALFVIAGPYCSLVVC